MADEEKAQLVAAAAVAGDAALELRPMVEHWSADVATRSAAAVAAVAADKRQQLDDADAWPPASRTLERRRLMSDAWAARRPSIAVLRRYAVRAAAPLGRPPTADPRPPRRPCRRCWLMSAVALLVTLVVSVGLLVGLNEQPASGDDVLYWHGAVAADVGHCSSVGVAMLQRGGSATDAAIAALLCNGVMNGQSSGIGGGGFMLVRQGGQAVVFDFRETAPSAAFRDMFRGNSTLSTVGGLAVAVPGELRGMAAAHARFGRLPWRTLFEPAIQLARDGFPCGPSLAAAIRSSLSYILADEGLSAVYAPGRVPLGQGDTVRNVALANTLETVASAGADAFYNGSLAQQLVADINNAGGNMTLSDFQSYTVVERVPVNVTFGALRVLSAPPPASGPVLLLILNIMNVYGSMPDHGLLYYQRLVESFKFAYARRSMLGDPAFVNVSAIVRSMLDPAVAAAIRRRIVDNATFPIDYYGGQFNVEMRRGTTHLCVQSGAGDAVSVMSTVNLLFGAKLMSPSTGVILNNEMDDFSSPNITNAFGVPPSPANFIVPGKRPMSSSSPIVALDAGDNVRVVAGASGGTKITTATAQVFLDVASFGEAIAPAIAKPRLHDQLIPNITFIEPTFPAAIAAGLRCIGHDVQVWSDYAVVQGIVRSPQGWMAAASDPRKGGRAAGY